MSATETARHVERVVGAGGTVFDEVRARVERLSRLGEPALLVPSRVAMVRDDQVVVAELPRDEYTLRAIVDARGALRAGECVWWGMEAAQALSTLHRNGMAHGALDADAVIVTHGRVGLARLVDGSADANAADDVAALGRLLISVVRSADADRIRAWTEPMTHSDPAGRPTAAMVARALSSCAPPEELIPQPAGVAAALRRSATARGGPGARSGVIRLDEARWWRARRMAAAWARRVGVGVLAAALGAGVIVGGAWLFREGPGESGGPGVDVVSQASEATPVFPPVDAARELTLSRFAALSSADGDALVSLTVEGSPARADAQAMAEALVAGSLRVEGLEGVVEAADLVMAPAEVSEPEATVVRVRYRLGPHAVVRDGTTVDYAGYVQTVDLTLAPDTARGWLVQAATLVVGTDDGTGVAAQLAQADVDAQ